MPSRAAVLQERFPMSLSIPPEFERTVRERVGTGWYRSAYDVFNACLGALYRLESERESIDWSREQHDATRAEFREGIPPEDYESAETFRIPRAFAVAVRQHMESGRYASPDALFDAILSALDEQEKFEAENIDWLRAELQIGDDQIARGEVVDGEVAFARLRKRFGGRDRP
jgi:antitoxin ParD1/3/4